jgi:hypothetical protein
MKRPSRLRAAPHWLPTYAGKSLVRGYAKHFAVDLLCALAELQLLGVEIDPQCIAQIKAGLINKQRQRAKERARKQEKAREERFKEYGAEFGFDDDFAFIAGFTSGGAPYGITGEDRDAQLEDIFA